VKVHVLHILLIILITGASYSPTLHAPFVFDDRPNIVENDALHITSLQFDALYAAARKSINQTRIIPNITFALNYYFGGLEVFGYHVVNLCIHISTALLFYALFLTTLPLAGGIANSNRMVEVCLISALVWAIHPLQTNGVTFVVQRMTSMATLFFVGSLLCFRWSYLFSRFCWQKYALWAGCIASGVLALMSKEISVVLPVIMAGYYVYFINNNRKLNVNLLAAAGVLVIAFAAAMAFLYTNGRFMQHIAEAYSRREFTPVERLLTEPRVIFLYLSLIFLPLPSRLNINHDFILSHSLLDPPLTLVAIFGIFLLLAGIVLFYRKNKLLSFGLFWFLATLVIESSVLPLEIIFEHRVYLPSALVIFACIASIYRYVHNMVFLRVLWLVVIVLLCVATWQRNQVWSSEISLWEDVTAKSPKLARAYEHLTYAYNEAGRQQKTREICQTAFANKAESAILYNNCGKAALDLRLTDIAVRELEYAVRLDIYHPDSHYNLGLAYGQQGQIEKARREMILGMKLKSRKGK